MAEEKSSNNLLILIGIGIILGAAFVYSEMKKQQLMSQAYAQAQVQQMQYFENLNSAVKRLEGQVQVVQTLQPLPVLQPLQPLKLLEPELMQSLKPLEPLEPLTVLHEQPPEPLKPATIESKDITHRHDTEFLKWYTDTIIKSTVQQAARESAETVIKQFVDVKQPSQKTLKSKPVKWVINRDPGGAIMSIETIKESMQSPAQEADYNLLINEVNINDNTNNKQ